MLENENAVLDNLCGHISSADKENAVVKHHRVYVSVGAEQILDALRFAKEELYFSHLCTITGLDTGDGYEFIYHTAHGNGTMLNIKYRTVGGDGVSLPSVLPIYEGATFYEKELEGLLGVTVAGLPEGRQYPLPDNWPKGQYPMRKTWTPNQTKE